MTGANARAGIDRRELPGPFDVVGDVHGCATELEQVLGLLGYVDTGRGHTHPAGRCAVFVGDLATRGPRCLDTIEIVARMRVTGSALGVRGNHDHDLAHALAEGMPAMAELDALDVHERASRRAQVLGVLAWLEPHLVLDGGRLVIAHAGLPLAMHGCDTPDVREFARVGRTTNDVDEFGLRRRWDWAGEYRGRATVVYGHTPMVAPRQINRTVNIDTGCVYGGRLTAYRHPEGTFVSVPAERAYAVPKRPLRTVV